jgi:hypothetical protein
MVKLPGNTEQETRGGAVGGGFDADRRRFLLIYFVVFPTSSPKPFKLATTTAVSLAHEHRVCLRPSSARAGNWSVAAGSEAGYRVREKLAFLPARERRGRAHLIDHRRSSAERVQRGPRSRSPPPPSTSPSTRSKATARCGMKKSTKSGLKAAAIRRRRSCSRVPSRSPQNAVAGRVTRASVTGVFNIHGTSKRETLPVEFSLAGATLEAAGSLTFPWSEFGMSAPSVGGFVSVTEKATMEFDLRLRRAQ